MFFFWLFVLFYLWSTKKKQYLPTTFFPFLYLSVYPRKKHRKLHWVAPTLTIKLNLLKRWQTRFAAKPDMIFSWKFATVVAVVYLTQTHMEILKDSYFGSHHMRIKSILVLVTKVMDANMLYVWNAVRQSYYPRRTVQDLYLCSKWPFLCTLNGFFVWPIMFWIKFFNLTPKEPDIA